MPKKIIDRYMKTGGTGMSDADLEYVRKHMPRASRGQPQARRSQMADAKPTRHMKERKMPVGKGYKEGQRSISDEKTNFKKMLYGPGPAWSKGQAKKDIAAGRHTDVAKMSKKEFDKLQRKYGVTP